MTEDDLADPGDAHRVQEQEQFSKDLHNVTYFVLNIPQEW